jgi:drug/metabolite transporter (DMT)-like permease
MGTSRREMTGIAAAAASTVLGGACVVATRHVMAATDAATLGALRYGIGALCLVLLAVITGMPRPRGRDAITVALLGVLFFTAFSWLFNEALRHTTAAHGSLALSTVPFLTLVLAVGLRREALTARKAAGVVAAMAGVALALADSATAALPEGYWRGDLMMIAAALCGALYNVLSLPYLAALPALAYTAHSMLAGALAMAGLAAATGSPGRILAFDPGTWAIVAFLGVLGGALTFWLWSFGLERTTPTRVAITITFNPMVSLLLGAVLLGEPVGSGPVAGLVLVVAGVLLVSAQPSPRLGGR